ncbi:PREDICTED: uncharacterized protein LOC105148595 isoform X2 [Acromyrmex echinatior]|uniref:uncharacterized protein LOC105148595 isoform X2 n=1 Tax=Acromyrmex echinatior TaxID=103372 RepID=UPI000580B957|nr:PREDICTED: uncharacterized protein LOC105148595 isoform X2 [Acromyrmex echinatior]
MDQDCSSVNSRESTSGCWLAFMGFAICSLSWRCVRDCPTKVVGVSPITDFGTLPSCGRSVMSSLPPGGHPLM